MWSSSLKVAGKLAVGGPTIGFDSPERGSDRRAAPSENSINYKVQGKVGEPATLGRSLFARECGRGLGLSEPAACGWSPSPGKSEETNKRKRATSGISIGRDSEPATFGEDGSKARPTTFEGLIP